MDPETFQIFLPAGNVMQGPKVGLLEQLPNKVYRSEPELNEEVRA
jgi:hypothetical protein